MRAALQFLTILPVPAPHVAPGLAAVWYPAVGALVGLLAAGLALLQHATTPLGATLAIAAVVLITGGLHEDGLADIADAVRAGRSRERILEILKDSRIGAYGATAIALSILVRWQAMAVLGGSLHGVVLWCDFALAFAASRAAMVVLAASTPAAAPGLGAAFGESLPRYAVPVIVFQLAALALAIPGPAGWVALLAGAASVLVVRAWLMRRLGGFTGDGLGFQCQVTEAVILLVLAWQA